ncbi:Piwi-like protein [Caenorhabditis elegans]|uniref:Piwi-like protein n=1 Tax=Caenorhabditis elegans TaxID=6239 RepID=D9N120_CAEEL|nr:Piwi-like protein [Caenorhabditis elegans]CCD72518.2 Piwi-like protein [Caenorhabditis elegans]|eukprot:NP_495151.3 Piwi-like protein [Caenorhabditis elegans]
MNTGVVLLDQNDQKLYQTTANDACINRLKELNVESGAKIYTTPTEPGTLGKQVDVGTNIFGVEVTKETTVHRFVVHAKADLTSTKEVTFTKKGKEDFVVLDRREKCCNLFFNAVEKNPDFFKMKDGNHIVYDGQSTLYTTINLFSELDCNQTKSKVFQINGADTGNDELKTLPCISLEIHAPRDNSITISAKILGERTADQNIEVNNREYTQFLELALNQHCTRETKRFGCFEHGKVYFLNATEEGFDQRDCVDVGDGKALYPGLKKTIQFIEGPFGRGQNNPSLVIDGMKAAFHKEQTVIQKLFEITGQDPSNGLSSMAREKATPVIKGLDCYSMYTSRKRHLRIVGIFHESATGTRFELPDGKTCSIAEYFRDKYSINLQYPKANLVVCKDRGNNNYFPAELMTISKNQRATIPQQTQSQKTTKECAVLPDVRQRIIIKGKTAVNITAENELLNALGIKVYSEPLKVSLKELGYQRSTVKSELGKWRPPPGSFVKPAAFQDLWALYAVGNQNSRFSVSDLSQFTGMFIDACKKRGMIIKPPSETSLCHMDNIISLLENAAASKCKFAFVITDDSITHLHKKYKALEQKSMMVIQDMKISKANSVVKDGKRLTLENVINKTNMKLGGLNYTVSDAKKSMTDEQLIIGVGVSAPPAGTKYMMDNKGHLNPQIIGFASNAVANHEFVGDFVLAPSGQDTMASIEDVLKSSIDLFEMNRNTLPKRIIIYRSGASDGSHASILAYEIPLARATIQGYSKDINLIYIIVTKEHSYRFFRDQLRSGGKATEMNIPPGIVLDSAVTNPACKQFFLNGHTTLQGTAKTPLYTILADDCNAPMDRLEELTYTLCHHHQIVALSTSIPTPLYVANEYAKRGRDLWAHGPNEANEYHEEHLKELSKQLGYKNTVFNKTRINA